MNIATMFSIALGTTIVMTGLGVLRIWKLSGTPSRTVIGGALLQSALFGSITGFVLVPNAPPPPPLTSVGGIRFLLAIALIEIVRSGLLLRLRFIPDGLRHYRLKNLSLQRESLDKRVKALEALIEKGPAARYSRTV